MTHRRTSAAAVRCSSVGGPARDAREPVAPSDPRACCATRRGEGLRRALEDELARGEIVVGTAVDPEQLGIPLDFRQGGRVDPIAVSENAFQHVAHFQTVRVSLVVVNVATGKCGPVEMPDQDFLVERQCIEAIRVNLRDGRFVNSLEQILVGYSSSTLLVPGRRVGLPRQLALDEVLRGSASQPAHRGRRTCASAVP